MGGWHLLGLNDVHPVYLILSIILSLSGCFSFLVVKNIQKMKFYSSNIKNSQWRGWGSPLASFWGESTEKKSKNLEQTCSFIYPSSSLSPTCRCWTYASSHRVLRVIVVSYAPSYAPSLDPMCRRWIRHLVVRVLYVVSSGESASNGLHRPCLLLARVDFE